MKLHSQHPQGYLIHSVGPTAEKGLMRNIFSQSVLSVSVPPMEAELSRVLTYQSLEQNHTSCDGANEATHCSYMGALFSHLFLLSSCLRLENSGLKHLRGQAIGSELPLAKGDQRLSLPHPSNQ